MAWQARHGVARLGEAGHGAARRGMAGRVIEIKQEEPMLLDIICMASIAIVVACGIGIVALFGWALHKAVDAED